MTSKHNYDDYYSKGHAVPFTDDGLSASIEAINSANSSGFMVSRQ